MKDYSFLLILILTVLLSSCTIQKRTYNSGFHVNWHVNFYNSNKTQDNQAITQKKSSPIFRENNSINSTLNSQKLESSTTNSTPIYSIKKVDETEELLPLKVKSNLVKQSCSNNVIPLANKPPVKQKIWNESSLKPRINASKMIAKNDSLDPTITILILGVLLGIFAFLFIPTIGVAVPPATAVIILILLIGAFIFYWMHRGDRFDSFIS
jgi:hypothetical protein